MAKSPPSYGWQQLQAVLMATDEAGAIALLDQEKAGANRQHILLRIRSRINRLRAQRERREIKESSR